MRRVYVQCQRNGSRIRDSYPVRNTGSGTCARVPDRLPSICTYTAAGTLWPPDGDARQLETAEAGETGGAVHRARGRRPDAEECRERRIRDVVHWRLRHAGRVHRAADDTVVEEAVAESPDAAR